MTNEEWNALRRMNGINQHVDGYGLVTVSTIIPISTYVPTVKVTYYYQNILYFTIDRELTTTDRDMLRAVYDKYLSIKHELV